MFHTGVEGAGTGRIVLTPGTQFTFCLCIYARGYLLARMPMIFEFLYFFPILWTDGTGRWSHEGRFLLDQTC